MKERIVQRFQAGAKTYEQSADIQRQVAANLSKHLPTISPKRILEIGCGTGIFSQYLVSLYPQARLNLLDISSAMVQICQQRFSSYPQIQVSCCDIELFQADEKFDLIVSNMTLHWLQDNLYKMDFLKNLLNQGGGLFFSILGENSFLEWKQICQDLQVEDGLLRFPSLASLRGYYPQWRFTEENIIYCYHSAYAFLHSFKQLGTQTSRIGYQPMTLSRLRQVIRHFDAQSFESIKMTYHVLYGN